jgi:hypothetical protein
VFRIRIGSTFNLDPWIRFRQAEIIPPEKGKDEEIPKELFGVLKDSPGA